MDGVRTQWWRGIELRNLRTGAAIANPVMPTAADLFPPTSPTTRLTHSVSWTLAVAYYTTAHTALPASRCRRLAGS